MKLFATVSFIFTIVSLANTTSAQVAYYGIDAILAEDGNAEVKLTITFREPVKTFNTTIIGRANNFTATTNIGTVDCSLDVRGISDIGCTLSTQEQRTLTLGFRTPDFVKQLDETYIFSNDFSIGHDIDRVFATVKMPSRMTLVNDGRLSFPENADVLSEGTIIVWSMTNFKRDQDIKLEVLYEKLPVTFFDQLRLHQILIFGLAVGGTIAFLLVRYFRKSEQLVLSVLDEFERKVIDIISLHQGEVNQRKVVLETNLSKAKVSRVVKSLAERGLIEVQRLGRTNKLKLVKKKFMP